MQLVLRSFGAGSPGRSYRRGWNLGTSAMNPRLGITETRIEARGGGGIRVSSCFIGSSNSKVCKWKWLDLWLRTQHTLWTTDSWKETAEMITFSHLILRNCPRSFCNPMPSRYVFPSTAKGSSQSHSSISECIWVSYISCLEPLLGPHVSVWRKHGDRGDPSQRYDLTLRNALLLPVEVPFLHPIHGTFGASWGPKRWEIWEVPDVTASMLNKQVVLWNLVCLGGFRPKKKWCILYSFVCSLCFCLHRRQGNMQRQAWRSNALWLKDAVASSKILRPDNQIKVQYL